MSFRTFIFLFVAFDIFAFILLQKFGPVVILASDGAQVVIGFPWQNAPETVQIAEQKTSKFVRKAVYVNALQPAQQQAQAEQTQPVGPNTVYRCAEPKTGHLAYQSEPCDSVKVQKQINISENHNKSVPLAETQQQAAYVQAEYVNRQPTATLATPKPQTECDILKISLDQWRHVETQDGRRIYAEYLYRYNTKCR